MKISCSFCAFSKVFLCVIFCLPACFSASGILCVSPPQLVHLSPGPGANAAGEGRAAPALHLVKHATQTAGDNLEHLFCFIAFYPWYLSACQLLLQAGSKRGGALHRFIALRGSGDGPKQRGGKFKKKERKKDSLRWKM